MIGSNALLLMYLWLACAIVASYLSSRKGYTEKSGLAAGLLLHIIGVIIFLVIPAKPHSKWKTIGRVRAPQGVRRRAARGRRRGHRRQGLEDQFSARRRASRSGVTSVVPGEAHGRAAANVAPRGRSQAVGV